MLPGPGRGWQEETYVVFEFLYIPKQRETTYEFSNINVRGKRKGKKFLLF